MAKTVAIIGASSDRRKFGNKSLRAHAAAGWQVFPVHPSETIVEEHPAFKSIAEIPERVLDRISMYLPPPLTLTLLESFPSKLHGELWLNPGTWDEAVLKKATELGLKIRTACSIIDVGYSPSDFD